MNLDLIGKNALVGGSSKGIGKAISMALAELGAHITLMARTEETLMDTIRELDRSQDQRHDFIMADYSKPELLAETISRQLKETTYQILVNNTGGPPPGNILDAIPEQFESAFRNHVICNHLLATLLVPGMKASGYGRIINVISTSVKIPIRGLGVSNTIRAAVANWSKTLSHELAPFGITVNNILPGATGTERLQEVVRGMAVRSGKKLEEVEREWMEEIPMKRFGDPSEIAAAAAFLASPAASYITGINLPVDGGRTGSL